MQKLLALVEAGAVPRMHLLKAEDEQTTPRTRALIRRPPYGQD